MNQKAGFLSDDDYEYVYDRTTRLTVDTIVQSEAGILLTCRKIEPFLGHWHTIGGRVWLGEGVEEAAKRIVKKEIGLEIEIIRLLDYFESAHHPEGEGYGKSGKVVRHSFSPVFLARPVTGVLTLNHEASAAMWWKIMPDKIIPWHNDLLRKHNLVS